MAWTVVVRSASDLALDLTSQYAGREGDLLMQGSKFDSIQGNGGGDKHERRI